jgi:hypothetical protein
MQEDGVCVPSDSIQDDMDHTVDHNLRHSHGPSGSLTTIIIYWP